MLGVNPLEQEIMDITNEIARNGFIHFSSFCTAVHRKYRKDASYCFIIDVMKHSTKPSFVQSSHKNYYDREDKDNKKTTIKAFSGKKMKNYSNKICSKYSGALNTRNCLDIITFSFTRFCVGLNPFLTSTKPGNTRCRSSS